MKKIKVFLGAYINFSNAQNLNCLVLAKYLNKELFEIYTLELYSGNLPNNRIEDVTIFKCFYPHKVSKYFGYLWGVLKSDIVYLPKGEIPLFNRILCKVFGKKSFTTIEGIIDDILVHSSKRDIATLLYPYQKVDSIYPITEFVKNYNESRHGLKLESKILYLLTEIPYSVNSTKENSLRNIIFIGNDFYRKGFKIMVELALLFRNINFAIIGADVSNFLINFKKIPTNIKIYGAVDRKELISIANGCQLHILPSRSEGFPRVIIEMASLGIPTITFGDYGADEWISTGTDGFVVKEVEEIKEIINRLLQEPKQLNALSSNAIELSKSYSWQTKIKDWEEEILNLYKGSE